MIIPLRFQLGGARSARRTLSAVGVLFAAAALSVATFVASAQSAAAAPLARLPLKQNGGTWSSGHVQGIAVDTEGGYIYYSFTNLLAKYDFSGKLIGTLVGWTGHLGDLDFNPADGQVYGSLEYKKDKAFYIAVIDVNRIDRVGVDASGTEILPHRLSSGGGQGLRRRRERRWQVRRQRGDTPDHRYGCSGIDGVGFGPAFGRADGPRYLTVAYGIYGDTARDRQRSPSAASVRHQRLGATTPGR